MDIKEIKEIKVEETKFSKVTGLVKKLKKLGYKIRPVELKAYFNEQGIEPITAKLYDLNDKADKRQNVYPVSLNGSYDYYKRVKVVDTSYKEANIYDFHLLESEKGVKSIQLKLVNVDSGVTDIVSVSIFDRFRYEMLVQKGNLLGLVLKYKSYKNSHGFNTLTEILGFSKNAWTKEFRRDFQYSAPIPRLEPLKPEKAPSLLIAQLNTVRRHVFELHVINNDLVDTTMGMIEYMKTRAQSMNLEYSMIKGKKYLGVTGFFQDFYEFYTQVYMKDSEIDKDIMKDILAELAELDVIRVAGYDSLSSSAKKFNKKTTEVYKLNMEAEKALYKAPYVSKPRKVVLNMTAKGLTIQAI